MPKTTEVVVFEKCTLKLITNKNRKLFDLVANIDCRLRDASYLDREKIAHLVAQHVNRPHEEIYQTLWTALGA